MNCAWYVLSRSDEKSRETATRFKHTSTLLLLTRTKSVTLARSNKFDTRSDPSIINTPTPSSNYKRHEQRHERWFPRRVSSILARVDGHRVEIEELHKMIIPLVRTICTFDPLDITSLVEFDWREREKDREKRRRRRGETALAAPLDQI